MSIFMSSDAGRFAVQQTNVLVRHEVEIVWPDGTISSVHHDEDVTAAFRDPANADKHAALLRGFMMSRVNTRINLARR